MSLMLSNPSQEREIRDLAAARREPPEKILTDLVGEALSTGRHDGGSRPAQATEQDAAWNAFVAGMADWSKGLPPGHRLDDDRESIYAGRGE